MATFDEYESDFRQSVDEVLASLKMLSESAGEKRSRMKMSCEKKLDEAKGAIDRMQLLVSEAKTRSPAAYPSLQNRFTNSKSELERARKELREACTAVANADRDRDALFGDRARRGHDEEDPSDDGIMRRKEKDLQTLYQARQTLGQAEEMAIGASAALDDHKVILLRVKDRIGGVHNGLTVGYRRIRSMLSRAQLQRMILWIIIGLLVLVVVILIAVKVSSARSSS